jgi:catecholate siderophore receptor
MIRVGRRRLPSLLGIATIMASVLAAAQNAPDPAAASAPPKTLPKVVVSADQPEGYKADVSASLRTDTLLRDEPASVTVVTRKSIDDQNMQNLADVVRYVPGIGIAQGEGNRDNPVFRGSSSSSDLFIDGMRDDIEYYRDLYNIERVEALKGPNGMLFGRGGVGGVINRVSKQAGFDTFRSATLQGGSYSNGRVSLDLNQPFSDSVALRLNTMYENSDTYRDDVSLERYGINPTMTLRTSEDTRITFGAEYFHDERTADRGVSSFAGRPLETDPSEFFGDPAQSETHSTVKAISALFEHQFSDRLTLRNRTRYADYDKFYQNVYPGVVNAAGTDVQILAYNNAMQRDNLFNQTDLLFSLESGALKHSLLAGVELGRQVTDNFRNTGFFDTISPTTTSINVPLSDPRTTLPVSFRQSATDADNHGVAKIAAAYVQDQIEFSPHWLATLGLRYDNFQVDFDNHRSGATFSSDDGLLSPRAGIIFKPIEPVSLYASYSLSYQPRAGAQLSSLNLTNEALDPEEFTNYEVGAKWDFLPGLAFTAALYNLERTNVAIADPLDPTRSILIDGQRVKGIELGIAGNITQAWSVMGAYAYQDGEVLNNQSATVLKGARLAALPENTFSLWNRYDINPMWGVGLGLIYRDTVLAATENLATPAVNVTLPSYTRVDAAVFFTLNARLRAQLNVENLFDEEYFASANSNTNITPGSPLAARVSVIATF